jgi:hypothetical protein
MGYNTRSAATLAAATRVKKERASPPPPEKKKGAVKAEPATPTRRARGSPAKAKAEAPATPTRRARGSPPKAKAEAPATPMRRARGSPPKAKAEAPRTPAKTGGAKKRKVKEEEELPPTPPSSEEEEEASSEEEVTKAQAKKQKPAPKKPAKAKKTTAQEYAEDLAKPILARRLHFKGKAAALRDEAQIEALTDHRAATMTAAQMRARVGKLTNALKLQAFLPVLLAKAAEARAAGDEADAATLMEAAAECEARYDMFRKD